VLKKNEGEDQVKITVYDRDGGTKYIEFENEILLSKALGEHEMINELPCGGAGKCGKCRVIASGSLSELTASEKSALSAKDIERGVRLACCTKATGNCEVNLNYSITRKDLQGVTSGFMPEFELDPISGSDQCCGIAIDIGTTTVAAYLYTLPEGKLEGSVCLPNTQSRFGADVISRIDYANQNGVEALQNEILGVIEKIFAHFAKRPDICVITGNTTMLHLLCGYDVRSIGVAPYTPFSLFGNSTVVAGVKSYLPACISAYVGADITCAIIASDMMKQKSALLLDIGTNGEMAFFDGNILSCCATAAGPAFEGAGISCGMPACDGAINKVYLENGEVKHTVIGNKKALGICGSALIDVIAVMLELEIIDETGFLEEDYTIPGTEVTITARDVRAVQLAKSAIRSGIDTLLNQKGMPEHFYIAGGFGNYVDLENCVKIGLFPAELLCVSKVLGNAAGSGASVILLSKRAQRKATEIAQNAQTEDLASNPFFMEKYVENMMF